MTVDELVQELRRPLPKLPAHLFYDATGGELFDRITELPEYYQTRTEIALLRGIAADVVARWRPTRLAELGSGSAAKIGALLDAMEPSTCQLLDVNRAALDASIARLSMEHPGWTFDGVVGSFVGGADALGPGGGPRLVLFFGGTIGNFHPGEVPGFLADLRRILAPGDALVIGVDQVKDPAVLEAAYNDSQGVTAAFNQNMLAVINHRFGADFVPSAWEHRAFWDPEASWIQMRLRTPIATEVHLGGHTVRFAAGQELSTEISCKYTRASFAARVAQAGLSLTDWRTDQDDLFALAFVEAGPG